MFNIPGELTIKTIHGRNGDFNVGRLSTSVCELFVKNAELDQYDEGKYHGDFIVTKIINTPFFSNGRWHIEMRAQLGGMTLSKIDALTSEDNRRLTPQEVDPIDEEAQISAAIAMVSQSREVSQVPGDAPADGVSSECEPAAPTTPVSPDADDAALFGPLWPLGDVVALDSTLGFPRFPGHIN